MSVWKPPKLKTLHYTEKIQRTRNAVWLKEQPVVQDQSKRPDRSKTQDRSKIQDQKSERPVN